MKVIIVLFALLFVGKQIDARAIADLDEDDEACIAELHLNREKIEAVNTNKILPEDNAELTKLMDCSGKRQGLITSDGDVNYPKMTQIMLEAMDEDLKKTPALEKTYREVVGASIAECQSKGDNAATPGASLIKALNCVIKKLAEKS